MNIYCVLLKYINIPLRATKEIHYWISFLFIHLAENHLFHPILNINYYSLEKKNLHCTMKVLGRIIY